MVGLEDAIGETLARPRRVVESLSDPMMRNTFGVVERQTHPYSNRVQRADLWVRPSTPVQKYGDVHRLNRPLTPSLERRGNASKSPLLSKEGPGEVALGDTSP